MLRSRAILRNPGSSSNAPTADTTAELCLLLLLLLVLPTTKTRERIVPLPPFPPVLGHPNPPGTNDQGHHRQTHPEPQRASIPLDRLPFAAIAAPTDMDLHHPREPESDTRRIKLQRTDQAPRDPLLVPLDAVTRDDGRGREDEVRTERLDDGGGENGGPIRLARGHGGQDDLGDEGGEGADGQDPLGREAGDEPGGDQGGGGGAEGHGGEAEGGGEGGPVADFLLPGDEVPDEGGVGHEAEADDDDEGEEGRGLENGQG